MKHFSKFLFAPFEINLWKECHMIAKQKMSAIQFANKQVIVTFLQFQGRGEGNISVHILYVYLLSTFSYFNWFNQFNLIWLNSLKFVQIYFVKTIFLIWNIVRVIWCRNKHHLKSRIFHNLYTFNKNYGI